MECSVLASDADSNATTVAFAEQAVLAIYAIADQAAAAATIAAETIAAATIATETIATETIAASATPPRA